MSSVVYTSIGDGPGLVVIPGGTRRGRHYEAMAAALADAYTVHLIDRRGRGSSPPQGPGYGLDQEVSDAAEVLAETGSHQVFGHSYGGLVALHVALRHDLDRLIVYEPAVSVGGSIPDGWLPRYAELLAAGRDATAMVYFLHAIGMMPSGPAMVAVAWAMQRLTAEGRDTRAVLPTVIPEFEVVRAADSDGRRYAGITAPTLLLGGGRSPAYLQEVLPLLSDTIPEARLIMTPEFDHNAPDLGHPRTVADLIRA
jgi:pimeloyl-ACP methyl ester carboxylesterase